MCIQFSSRTILIIYSISLESESHSCDLQNGVIHEQAQAAGGGAAWPGPDLPPLHPQPAADQVRHTLCYPDIVTARNILRCKQELGELPAPFTRQWQQKGKQSLMCIICSSISIHVSVCVSSVSVRNTRMFNMENVMLFSVDKTLSC